MSMQAGERRAPASSHGAHGCATEGGADAVDPVCGMRVDPHTTGHRHAHLARTYYFCSDRCRGKFAAEPMKYLAADAGTSAHARVPEGAIYTCPMHPEVRRHGPGICPICGMALEPVLATAETGAN